MSSACVLASFWLLSLFTLPSSAHGLSPAAPTKEINAADGSFPTDESIASINQRLAQLELENRKLRDRLGLAEEASTKNEDVPADDRSISDIFASLALELAELGPDLVFELMSLLLVGGMVLVVTKGISLPAFMASTSLATEEKTTVTAAKQADVQLRGRAAAVPFVAKPATTSAAVLVTKPAADCGRLVAEGKSTCQDSDVALPAVASLADGPVIASLRPPPGLGHPSSQDEQEPSDLDAEVHKEGAQDGVSAEDVEPHLSTPNLSTEIAFADPGAPPGLEHVSLPSPRLDPTVEPVADAVDTVDEALEQEPDHAGNCQEQEEVEAAEPLAMVSDTEPESEPKASQKSSVPVTKSDDLVATKKARASRTKKTRLASKIAPKSETIRRDASDQILDDLDDCTLLQPGGQASKSSEESTIRQRERTQSKKKGRQQHRSQAQKRSTQDTGHRRRAWSCNWPCSWQLTLALAVMLGITLVGKAPKFNSAVLHVRRAAKETEKQSAQEPENLQQLKAKRNFFARQLAMMKLEQIYREAIVVADGLPAGTDTTLLLGASSDAKQLLDALKEVPDTDFPTVEKDVDKMLGTWRTRIVAAKTRAEPGEAPQCAAGKEL